MNPSAMTHTPRHCIFGTIEPPKSGHYRAFYTGPDEHRHRPPRAPSREDKARTVGDWIDEWLELRSCGTDTLGPAIAQDYAKDIRLRITEVDGKAARLRDIPLTHLTKRDIAGWRDDVSMRFLVTAVFNTYKHLRAALGSAVDRDIILSNPVILKAATKRPKAKRKELLTA